MRKVDDKGLNTELITNAGTLTAIAGAVVTGAVAFLRWLFGMHSRHVKMEMKLDDLNDRMDAMEVRSEVRAAEHKELMEGVRAILDKLEGAA